MKKGIYYSKSLDSILNILVALACMAIICCLCFVKIVMLSHETENAKTVETAVNAVTGDETDTEYNIPLEEEKTEYSVPLTIDTESVEAEAHTEAYIEEVSYEEIDLLARVVECEAGSSFIADEHKQLCAQVVINRMNSELYPDSMYDVVMQGQTGECPKQYACASRSDFFTLTPSEKSYDIARQVLYGEVTLPTDIIFQAEFPQGEVYMTFNYGTTTTYFGK